MRFICSVPQLVWDKRHTWVEFTLFHPHMMILSVDKIFFLIDQSYTGSLVPDFWSNNLEIKSCSWILHNWDFIWLIPYIIFIYWGIHIQLIYFLLFQLIYSGYTCKQGWFLTTCIADPSLRLETYPTRMFSFIIVVPVFVFVCMVNPSCRCINCQVVC